MKTLETLEACAHSICRALAPDTDDIEVRIRRSDGYGYDIRNHVLSPELSLGRVSVGLRALRDGKLSLAATSSLDPQENVQALKIALAAGQPTPLQALAGEAMGQSHRQLEGHDPAFELWASDPKRLRDLAAAVRDRSFAADTKGQLQSIEGSVSFGTTWTVLASNRGMASFKRSHGGLYTQVNSTHYRHRFLPRAPGGDELEALRDLGAMTLNDLPGEMVTPQEFSAGKGASLAVILAPSLLESILRHAGAEKFLGSSKNAGLSSLKEGEAIWDTKLSLMDTACDVQMATGRPCDDELVPTQENPLVEAGAVAGLVWSRRSAAEAADGQQSTGNGYRSPMLVEEPSEAPVRDSLTGLVMSPGKISKAELLAGVDHGIYLVACLGLHGADRARASFSTTVYDGFAIEKGKIVAQLMPGRWNVAGHLFPNDEGPGLLGKVELSSERDLTGSARLPWLRTELAVG